MLFVVVDARGRNGLEHNSSKYLSAATTSADEQLDKMHDDALLANVLLLQMQLTSVLQTKKVKMNSCL